MKIIKFNTGGQPFVVQDDELQQDEIYKAIENQFLDADGFVFSGCVVTGNAISAGLVYLDGRIREIPNANGLVFPSYIKASATQEYDGRIHNEDNQNKTTKEAYNAEITNTLPVSGDYITITAQGCSNKISYDFTNQTGFTAGRSYVEAVKNNFPNQALANYENFVNFNAITDDLGEFNGTTGEFTAQKNGIYQINFGGRVDCSTTQGFGFFVSFWDGLNWDQIASSLRNGFNAQGNITTSCLKKLSARQKIKCSVLSFDASLSSVLQEAHVSIARI